MGLSFNIVLTALGTAGLPFAREVFLVMGFGLGAVLFGIGLLSDIRSKVAPKGGIGLFFGTFNPFHNTHLAMVRRALDERGLDKIIIHPTLVPRIHADAFRKGELRVGRLESGFQIYETTEKADVNVDYFPTGRMFLPPETRKALIELAVAEAGLGDKVEVVFYARDLRQQRLPGRDRRDQEGAPRRAAARPARHRLRRHARAHICDECGWIYPWRILRRDGVSATAIRRGDQGNDVGRRDRRARPIV